METSTASPSSTVTVKRKPREVTCEVRSFKMLTESVFELGFAPLEPVEFDAGQFFSIVIPGAGPNGRDLRRAYSIASSPEKSPIELCVKLVEGGPGTNFLFKLRPGDRFKCFAPYGDFLFRPKAGRNACFIATGTGIAPFRSMVGAEVFQKNKPPRSWCLLGVREEGELLYMDEFPALGVEWVPTVSRPDADGRWKGFKGRVTDWLRAQGGAFPWLETEFYMCGNGAMIDEVKALLLEKGVQKTSIHQEIYYKTPKDAAAAPAAPASSE
jgi:CDP-4-dehydro-6-deoxyglucose reductase